MPQSDNYQTIELLSSETPVEHQILEEKNYGNSIFYMELSPEHSGKKLEFVYDVQRQEKKPYEDDSELS